MVEQRVRRALRHDRVHAGGQDVAPLAAVQHDVRARRQLDQAGRQRGAAAVGQLLVELLATVVEAIGLVGLLLGLLLGAVDVPFAIAFLLFAYGFGMLLSMACLLLDTVSAGRAPSRRDLLWLALWAVLEPLGYRQLTVVWRLKGIVRGLQGRNDWGVMTRTGFTPVAVEVARTEAVPV